MADTGTGDLVKRLESASYFMCVSCNEYPYPEERQCHHANDLRLVDGEPWCETCHDASGAWSDVDWRGRPVFDPFTELVNAAKAESADALEAAERVIAPFAQYTERYEGCGARQNQYPILPRGAATGLDRNRSWKEIEVGHIRAAADWLARHVTGERKGGYDGKD